MTRAKTDCANWDTGRAGATPDDGNAIALAWDRGNHQVAGRSWFLHLFPDGSKGLDLESGPGFNLVQARMTAAGAKRQPQHLSTGLAILASLMVHGWLKPSYIHRRHDLHVI